MTGYAKQQWLDGSTSSPYGPISAARLGVIEQAIFDVKTAIFNAKDYGAKGDGTTDDTAAIQAAITACIVTGGTVYLPAGTYKVTSTLDFSGMKGTNKGVTFQGAGSGNVFNAGFAGASVLANSVSGSCITAFGAQSGNKPIVSLNLRGFAVQNQASTGSAYTIDFDYATAGILLDDIYVDGQNLGGNGIAFRNFAHGQSEFRRVTCRHFTSGTGILLSVETTTHASAPNSGNSVFSGCLAMDCLTGWDIEGSANTLNSLTLNSCKAVNTSDVTGSVGLLANSTFNLLLNAFHAERFSTGIDLNATKESLILTPQCSYPTGTPDASSKGIRIRGAGYGNVVHAARCQTNLAYGISLEDTTKTNWCSGTDYTSGRVATSFFNNTSSGTGNVLWKLEDVNPVISFGQAITIRTKAGTFSDSDFTATPADGTMAVDTTNNKLWIRTGGAWKSVALS